MVLPRLCIAVVASERLSRGFNGFSQGIVHISPHISTIAMVVVNLRGGIATEIGFYCAALDVPRHITLRVALDTVPVAAGSMVSLQ